jgi:triacylglycerol lipase
MKQLIPLITLLACTTPARSADTVVLLHGLCRSSRSMNRIAKELRKEGYTVINHGYPSRSATIEELSAKIFRTLQPRIQSAEKVHFVTHSMGGIILRFYLEEHGIPNIGRTVMLAPPNRGSEVTDKLGKICLYRWINGPAGNQLGTGQNDLPLRLKRPHFELGIITGDRTINPILSMLIPGRDDGKVAVTRTTLNGATDTLRVHATHACMMRNKTVIRQTRHFLKHDQFASAAR